ncbi:hypothetical protein RJ639_046921 [Escallonia herrerae]|uniref:Cotton fiber protein n=1 Tax=Escallonia herrerae TaxID=1293975 RepID=A0AA88W3P6_9ASTE|nr:hypothetical protein RJ639_046921 [Escallonia herrerae]
MQHKKKADAARRAWNIVRLALLWARKGGVFKRRVLFLMMDLSKNLRSLRHGHHRGALHYHYGERELSFDDTPVIHVKMHRPSSLRFRLPHIPCINPRQVDFDFDFDDDDNNAGDGGLYYDNDVARKSFLLESGDEGDTSGYEACEEDNTSGGCDEGIDLKAEEFIAKFYAQMKLQRQTSYLQYH